MMHNNEYAQSEKPEIDNAVVNKSLMNETNGLNNNLIDIPTRNGESNEDCNDYSSIEELLTIDHFITQTENSEDQVGQCNEYDNVNTNIVDYANFSVGSDILSYIHIALSKDGASVPEDDNIHSSDSRESITDSNKSTTTTIGINEEHLLTIPVTGVGNVHSSNSRESITDSNKSTTTTIGINEEHLLTIPVTGVGGLCNGNINDGADSINNLNVPPSSEVFLTLKESNSIEKAERKIDGQSKDSIDSDANFINANAHITNSETSSSSTQSLNVIEENNDKDTPTVPVAQTTKTSKTTSLKKHFPKFIELYCVKCGESPWSSKYYTNQTCPTCENKASLRCCKCKQESDKYEHIVYHLKTKCAPNDIRYKCSQCDYDTFVRSSLKYHIKSHEPSNNIKCSDCNISLKNKKSLENHKRYSCPSSQRERLLKCPNCCKGYINEICLRKHEKNCLFAQKR